MPLLDDVAVTVLATSLLFGCSGSESEAGAGGSSGTTGADGGADAEVAADAPADTLDSGLNGSHEIICGAAACATASEVCCVKGESAWCEPRPDASIECTAPDGGLASTYYCDDSLDCAPGNLCCSNPNSYITECVPPESCKGVERCQPGSSCVSQNAACVFNLEKQVYGLCKNPSPEVWCNGITCPGAAACCGVGTQQVFSCQAWDDCADQDGNIYECIFPSNCGAGMQCCGAAGYLINASRCFFECPDQLPDILCLNNGDCPTALPNCTEAPEYFAGVRRCTK